jgi:putative membrane protein
MSYFYVKALHIIFVVTWFAGLFYIVRLFIYHTEAESKDEPERAILKKQFSLMERRLWYGITWPSAVITLILGNYLGYSAGWYMYSWFWTKYSLVVMLFIYHLYCHFIFLQLQRNEIKHSSSFLRILNELATVFLVSIIFVVTIKNSLSMLWGIAGLFSLMAILFLAIKVYKKIRK